MSESKESKLDQVIHALISNLLIRDISQINVSQLAKDSGVSRGWIYKYLGNNIDEIARLCFQDYTLSFAMFKDIKCYNTKEELITALKSFSRRMINSIEKRPDTIKLYWQYRFRTNFISDVIKNTEAQYLDFLSHNICDCLKIPFDKAVCKAQMIHSMRMGAITSILETNPHNQDLLNELDLLIDKLL